MKFVFALLLLSLSAFVSATDYYIKTGGNDLASGTSDATAWASIEKVNAAFSSMNPGDRILFKRGDTFYGTINITKSGTAGNQITIGAYGTGEKPMITGFTTVTGWTNVGNGIFSVSLTSEAQTIMVTIDGIQYAMGRWPDDTYNIFESAVSNTSITDNELSGATDWTGAEVVIRKNDWSLDRCCITDHTGGQIKYTSLGTAQDAIAKHGYFIQNDLKCLTRYGEWYHDAAANKFYMYFGTVDPVSKTIKVATRNTLIFNNGKDYITVNEIHLSGSISHTITFVDPANSYCSIQNSVIDYAGLDGIHLWGQYGIINNNLITHCNQAGIKLVGDYHTITSNNLSNIGILAGQALNGSLASGILINNNNCLLKNNFIENVGYCGIKLSSSADIITIQNNYLNNILLVLNDGGGIYTAGEGVSRKIDGNIIRNVIGNSSGTPYPTRLIARGIYLDVHSTNTTITNNTVANCSEGGYMIHRAHENKLENNTAFNNGYGMFFQNSSGSDIRNITMNNNIFFAKGSSQLSLKFATVADDILSFGTSNNNYCARPVDDNLVFQTYSPSTGSKDRTLSGWQTFTSQDLNSKKSPVSVSDTSKIDFYYNPTTSNKVVSLVQPMIDVKGAKYSGSITLLPYTSVILMPDPNPSQPAAIPVFSSSVLENTAPAVLVMTYSLSMANIIPASGAFTVKVNSVVRTVSSVSISGTNVMLTLSSPVFFGDVVTVAYTKPSSNPLQTAAGGQAVSLTAQTVKNNIAAPVNPTYVSSVIENVSPSILAMTYNLSLTNIVPASSAFTVKVNSVVRAVSSVSISGTKVMLTLSSPVIFGDIITVAYTKSPINPLQTSDGGQAITITSQSVKNNCTAPANQPPVVSISSPTKGDSYNSPATITIDVDASDPDGHVSKVELFNGSLKLGEMTTEPYSCILKDLPEGSYSLKAIATDNLKASTTSNTLDLNVKSYNENREFFNLYPNPNDGRFSINFTSSLVSEKYTVTVFNIIGKTVYREELPIEEVSSQFDLSHLDPGIYVVMISDDKIVTTQKFIKG